MSFSPRTLLETLGIADPTPGAGPLLPSENPATGAVLANVRAATRADYDTAVEAARARFAEWRMRPAPRRAELVRRLGALFRRCKEPLGALISLEVGKIRAEGLGEVQEMIDICDFAVGLGRQLHGLTIASERPRHRMMEQWHPIGPVGVITAFNFPMAVWAWNAALGPPSAATRWSGSPHRAPPSRPSPSTASASRPWPPRTPPASSPSPPAAPTSASG